MPNKNNIAWKRVIVEGLTILVSILLAFAIDAWWANSVDRSEEQRILISLRQELESNVSKFKQGLVLREAVAEAAFEILEVAEGVKPIPEAEYLDRLIGSLNWWHSSAPAVGALRTISESGKLSLVTDESLRSDIASIEAAYASIRSGEDQAYDTFKRAWMPYLYQNGHIAQVSNAQRTAPGTGSGEQPELPVLKPIDHSLLLSDREFVGVVTNIYWDQNDASFWLNSAINLLTRISADIESHTE